MLHSLTPTKRPEGWNVLSTRIGADGLYVMFTFRTRKEARAFVAAEWASYYPEA